MLIHQLSHVWIDFRGIQDADPIGYAACHVIEEPALDALYRKRGRVSPWHFGLNQGPIVLMMENCRTGLLWELMCSCPYIAGGLRSVGFTGAWL